MEQRRFQRFCRMLLVLVVCMFAAAGCKTSTDARAAATQLTATAKALGDYYTALECMVEKSDQLYSLQEALGGAGYDAETRQHVLNVKSEMGKRAALSRTFISIAASFAGLSGSTAATDVPASAAKLEAQVESLKVTGTLSQNQQSLMKVALELFVRAVQEHKERQAATAIDSFTGALVQLVASEAGLYDSLGSQYATLAQAVALSQVRKGRVDPAALLKPAFEPFSLTALPADQELREQLRQPMEQQIAKKAAAIESGQKEATMALNASLLEMAQRVHRVATDQPLAIDTTPLTLEIVEAWAAKIVAL